MHSVYLIDDDPLIIENLIKTVQWMENGFQVVGSSIDPHHAVEEIIEFSPDVVFSDLRMPTMSGTQLIKILKDNDISCEFILLSAFGTFEDARNFFLMDGFDYLLKPLQQADAEIVLERLSRKLAKKECIQPSVSFAPTSNANFDDLVKYLSDNFFKKITLNFLSKKFNISSNYICNLFAKHYNSTLTIFLTNLRMNEAAAQIKASERPFKEIAIDCGYKDYFYFCRVFKEYYGITPSQYREDSLLK
ncbi:response regulator transcription factor [Anaerovorax odorimutans]|uniref:response regulator transcription factor n=1 Tax=Anaerovorax odorimutans TaxID=109327 RepID=UPI00042936E4|nr:helix-turn-helix domain-containing protein [Anaerovorax odorimutans]